MHNILDSQSNPLYCLAVALLMVPLAISGCGRSRVAFSGEVLRAGQPVELGFVSFQPIGERTSGPAANVPVEFGKYEFTRENGPVAGPHRVTVNVAVPSDKMKTATQQPVEATRWEFHVEVKRNGKFDADFELD